MDLSANSQLERSRHTAILFKLECEKRGRTITHVPTIVDEVKKWLRERGEPIRIFGENLSDVRDRLRGVLGREALEREGKGLNVNVNGVASAALESATAASSQPAPAPVEKVELQYTQALPALCAFREKALRHSSEKTAARLASELGRRAGTDTAFGKESNALNSTARNIGDWSRQGCKLEMSVFGDERPLTTVAFSSTSLDNGMYSPPTTLATSGWTGIVKLWDLEKASPSQAIKGHTDRVTGLEFSPNGANVLASCSIDSTARLYVKGGGGSANNNGDAMTIDNDTNDTNDNSDNQYTTSHILKGHKMRCCQVAWHPAGTHLATSSFDRSWRLWDAEVGGDEILLQDGHFNECYGLAFHRDGSLIASSDFGGVIIVWDLRSGKAIHNFVGHSKRVLSMDWSPNGYQLASGGDDGTVKIWDLRQVSERSEAKRASLEEDERVRATNK